MPSFVAGLMADAVVRKTAWPVRHTGLAEAVVGDGWGEWEGGLQRVEGVGCVLVLVPFVRAGVREVERGLRGWEDGVRRDAERIVDLGYKVMARRIMRDVKVDKLSRVGPRGVSMEALYPPLEFPVMGYRGEAVPVYGLPDLLGVERTRELVRGTAFEGAKCIALKKSHHTTVPQMWLSKLQAYLADE